MEINNFYLFIWEFLKPVAYIWFCSRFTYVPLLGFTMLRFFFHQSRTIVIQYSIFALSYYKEKLQFPILKQQSWNFEATTVEQVTVINWGFP